MEDPSRPSLVGPSSVPAADIIVRGILIIAIVLGHNRLLTTQWPWFFGFVYKWHVHGFFFLALASRGLRGTLSRAIDILVRFLVPFFIFLTLATVTSVIRGQFSLLAYLKALAIGSARLINAACDVSLFWFLPAFAGYLLFTGKVGVILARSRAQLVILCMICALCLGISFILPRSIALFIPLGLPIVAYIFPGAVLFCILNRRMEAMSVKPRLICAGVCLAVFVPSLLHVGQTHLDISLFKYGQGAPGIFFAGIAISVSASLFLKAAALSMPDSLASSLLTSIGRASLVIFLVHSFIQAPLVKVVQPFLSQFTGAFGIAAALVIAVISIQAGLWVDGVLRRLPSLRALVIPHDRNSYLDTLKAIRRDPWSIVRWT